MLGLCAGGYDLLVALNVKPRFCPGIRQCPLR
jgi:hypothetical protein